MIERVAVITGAASGVGFALARECARLKMHVILADVAKERLQSAVAKISKESSAEVHGHFCDVTAASQLEGLAAYAYERYDSVDILFNNAGIIGKLQPLWQTSIEQIHQVVDVNLYGVINGIQAFLPHFFEQNRRARIVNMASLYGLCSGSQVSSYAFTKNAIVSLSESLFFELQLYEKNVDVSVVCPSFMSTELIASSSTDSNPLQQVVDALVKNSKDPADVAAYILREIAKNQFYILPDAEVKEYCAERNQAIIEQKNPAKHKIEKLVQSITRRFE